LASFDFDRDLPNFADVSLKNSLIFRNEELDAVELVDVNDSTERECVWLFNGRGRRLGGDIFDGEGALLIAGGSRAHSSLVGGEALYSKSVEICSVNTLLYGVRVGKLEVDSGIDSGIQ